MWYKNIYPSILDYNFGGEGFWGFAPVKSKTSHWGVVFENNQYIPEWHDKCQQYTYISERSLSTFWKQNRCVFEISKEQYETLLESIKIEVKMTRKRSPNLKQDDSKLKSLETLTSSLYYNSTPINPSISLNWFPDIHNCVTWVLNKLDSIGIEIIDNEEWLPDNISARDSLLKKFYYLKSYNATFHKFQVIDSNLESIKGAKAFRDWARSMIDNNYICYVDENALEKEVQGFCKRATTDDQKYYEKIKHFYKTQSQLKSVYGRLDALLTNITQKFPKEDLQGDFELIYFDKQDEEVKILKAQNDYEPETAKFDLTIPANNCSISKFYPFIFVPKNEKIARVLYHKYDYGKVSQEYQNDRNEFYYNVLAGIQSSKYWSSSYHKMCKMQVG